MNYRSIAGALVIAVCLFSCSEDKTQTEEQVTEQPQQTDTLVSGIDTLRTEMVKILKADSGVFRGVTFGMTKDEVSDLEADTKRDSTEQTYLDYLFEVNELEEAEVSYFYGKDLKINKIQLNVYPEDEPSQKRYFDELKAFFSDKNGEPKTVTDKNAIWQTPEVLINMKKMGNEKVHDIQVDFVPAPVSTPTAAIK
ncbi:hypothetical protein [Sporocytophaga myxococcoides]|uniref:hypothetical protein n=1 Tax=Sporocytophaga myxococcoides TaxID=153721 RepID=UPI0003F9EABD|nr:hypothetical protein [Sporocytophaga myxococcoides]